MVVRVRPRALLAHVHLRVLEGVHARALGHVAEGEGVELGRAGGDHEPVEALLLRVGDDLALGRVGAGEHRRLGDGHALLLLDGGHDFVRRRRSRRCCRRTGRRRRRSSSALMPSPPPSRRRSLRRRLDDPRLLDVRGGLGDRGAGVEDRVGDVLDARGRAGDEDARQVGAAGVEVLVGLADVEVLVEAEGAVLEERGGLGVGLHADGEHDHVVLGLDDAAVALDVLVADDEVAVVLLGDLGDAALDEHGAHVLGLLVELVVALADGAHVHVVDGHVGQRQGAHDQLVVLDGVHAADARAERVADLRVAGAGAHDEADAVRDLAVAGTHDRVERPRRREQTVHLHAGDDVLELAVAVLGLGVGREESEAGGQHHGVDVDLDLLARACRSRCSRPGRRRRRRGTLSTRRSRGSGRRRGTPRPRSSALRSRRSRSARRSWRRATRSGSRRS